MQVTTFFNLNNVVREHSLPVVLLYQIRLVVLYLQLIQEDLEVQCHLKNHVSNVKTNVK